MFKSLIVTACSLFLCGQSFSSASVSTTEGDSTSKVREQKKPKGSADSKKTPKTERIINEESKSLKAKILELQKIEGEEQLVKWAEQNVDTKYLSGYILKGKKCSKALKPEFMKILPQVIIRNLFPATKYLNDYTVDEVYLQKSNKSALVFTVVAKGKDGVDQEIIVVTTKELLIKNFALVGTYDLQKTMKITIEAIIGSKTKSVTKKHLDAIEAHLENKTPPAVAAE